MLRDQLLPHSVLFLVALVIIGLKLSYTTRSRTFQGMPGFSYTWVTLLDPVGATRHESSRTVRKLKGFLAKLTRT